MSASLSTTCWHGLRLLQTKRLPKSSNVVPNWPTPETAEYVPRSGSKQKSRPLIETGFAAATPFGFAGDHVAAAQAVGDVHAVVEARRSDGWPAIAGFARRSR